jgi:hypothetical protein
VAATQPTIRNYELEVSPYERVASMLIALLVLIGSAVLIMFLLWLTSQIFASREAPPVLLEDIGIGDGGLTGGTELDAPLAEELGMETDLEEPSLEETLAVVADAVSSQVAMLEDPFATEDAVTGRGGSTGSGGGTGGGTGSGSGRARRWEVRFPPGNTIETYARQLDHFEIEMGVLIEGGRVLYAANFSQQRPTRREGRSSEEPRYYLTWRSGGLQQADRELLRNAGITAAQMKGKLILKFLTPELEADLQTKEKAYAGGTNRQIRTTYFGIRPSSGGYEFYVIDQTYK